MHCTHFQFRRVHSTECASEIKMENTLCANTPNGMEETQNEKKNGIIENLKITECEFNGMKYGGEEKKTRHTTTAE